MTVIRNLRWGKPIAIESVGNEPDFKWLQSDEVGINGYAYPRDEVLAALGAVPAKQLLQAESQVASRDTVITGLRNHSAAQAATIVRERDAHAATIERVRALAEEWTAREGNSVTASVTRHRGRELLGALEPPKPFVLPTEVPAPRIEAYNKDGERFIFELWTDGKKLAWCEGDGDYTPEQFMELFTGHRLLDGAE